MAARSSAPRTGSPRATCASRACSPASAEGTKIADKATAGSVHWIGIWDSSRPGIAAHFAFRVMSRDWLCARLMSVPDVSFAMRHPASLWKILTRATDRRPIREKRTPMVFKKRAVTATSRVKSQDLTSSAWPEWMNVRAPSRPLPASLLTVPLAGRISRLNEAAELGPSRSASLRLAPAGLRRGATPRRITANRQTTRMLSSIASRDTRPPHAATISSAVIPCARSSKCALPPPLSRPLVRLRS